MRKLILFLLLAAVSFVPTQAFIAKQTLGQVVDQIAEYEGLCVQEKADLRQGLLHQDAGDLGYLMHGDNTKLGVSIAALQVIKEFVKKSKNPLFNEWLINAIEKSYYEKVQFLVGELGADVDAVDKDGDTALLIAVMLHSEREVDSLNIIEFLLENGANTAAHATFPEYEGLTPLGYVAAQVVDTPTDWAPLVQLLVSYGASFDKVNSQGDSFTAVLEQNYDQKKKKFSVRCFAQKKIEKVLNCARSSINRILELPVVAEKVAERQVGAMAPFFPGVPGIADLVVDYAVPTTLVEYREQKRAECYRNGVLAQVPYLAEFMGDDLPWELEQEEEDGHNGVLEAESSDDRQSGSQNVDGDEQESKNEE